MKWEKIGTTHNDPILGKDMMGQTFYPWDEKNPFSRGRREIGGSWTRESTNKEHTYKCRASSLRSFCLPLCKHVSSVANISPMIPSKKVIGDPSDLFYLHYGRTFINLWVVRWFRYLEGDGGGSQRAPEPALGGNKQNQFRTPLGQRFSAHTGRKIWRFIRARYTSLNLESLSTWYEYSVQ